MGVLSIFLSLAQLMRQSVPSVGVYAHRRTNGLSRRSTHRLTDATQERGRRGCVYARVSCRGVSFDPSGARYPAVVSFASSTVSDEIKARKTAWADRHATPPPGDPSKNSCPVLTDWEAPGKEKKEKGGSFGDPAATVVE